MCNEIFRSLSGVETNNARNLPPDIAVREPCQRVKANHYFFAAMKPQGFAPQKGVLFFSSLRQAQGPKSIFTTLSIHSHKRYKKLIYLRFREKSYLYSLICYSFSVFEEISLSHAVQA